MKKISRLFLIIGIFIQVLSMAQNVGNSSKFPTSIQHPIVDAATRAQKYTERISKVLNLDASTSKKMYDAYLVRTQNVDKIHGTSESNKAQNIALKANKEAFENSVQGILNKEQFVKFQEIESGKKKP